MTVSAAGRLVVATLPEPGPDRDPDTARSRAEDILASAEFDDGRTVPERVLDWIGERLGDLVGGLGDGGGSAILSVLVLAALVAVVALGVWAFRARDRIGRGSGLPRRPEPVVSVSGDGAADPDWWAVADAAERDGRWAEALRARYRAGALVLADAGFVGDRPSATPGEQRRRLAAAGPDLVGDFEELAGRFEAAWYGGDEPDEGWARDAAVCATALRDRVADRAPAPASRETTGA